MAFKVVMVVNPAMLAKELPGNVEATGAEVSVHSDVKTEDDLLAICADADCIITHQGFFPFTPRVFKGLPKCRFLITASIGYDALDVPAATELGLGIVNLSGFCSEDLAEHAIALMLACARCIVLLDRKIHAGMLPPRLDNPEFRHLTILKGKTLGIVGFGNAGQLLVPKARAFDMDIIAYDTYMPPEVFKEQGVRQVSLDELVEQSDYISVHARLDSSTRHMFGLEQFKKMKRTAYIVNTARGGIIDQEALLKALDAGYLAGAGLDVTEPEPTPPDHPVLKYENVILTGHRAGSSPESKAVWGRQPAEEVARIMRGEWPISLVNPEVKDRYVARWGEMKEPKDSRTDECAA